MTPRRQSRLKEALKSALFAVLDFFSEKSRKQVLILGGGLYVLIAVADVMSFRMLTFSIFYLIPITLVTWYADRASGFFFAVLSLIVLLAESVTVERRLFHWMIPVWNTAVTFGFFCVFVFLLDFLRKRLHEQKNLALIDPLTGIANRRAFFGSLQNEISRLRRFGRPFTVALIDIDDFKNVNDNLGHGTGDEVLKTSAAALKDAVRGSDGVFRIGGDEFVALFPETGGDFVRRIMLRLEARLHEAMRAGGWSVTFSMGVSTFDRFPVSADDVVNKVDLLMYRAKKSGKNGIQYEEAPLSAS